MMHWIKTHRKTTIVLGLILLYLLYRWYKARQAAQDAAAAGADTSGQDAQLAALQNAIQAQGLGAGAAGSLVYPSYSTAPSGGMVPASVQTVQDNSGQLQSTVQASIPGNSPQQPSTSSGGQYPYAPNSGGPYAIAGSTGGSGGTVSGTAVNLTPPTYNSQTNLYDITPDVLQFAKMHGQTDPSASDLQIDAYTMARAGNAAAPNPNSPFSAGGHQLTAAEAKRIAPT